MFDPRMELLLTVFQAIVDPESEDGRVATWSEAQAAIDATGGSDAVDEDVALAVAAEDTEALKAILEEWTSGKRHLLQCDRDVLKRALKAFRKRLKVTVLDAESSLGGGPMSSGRSSSIVAITPPDRYPLSVWLELVRQGRLVDARHGMFELPPE